MVITVSELNIHPVKAMKGLSCVAADVTPLGFRHDRIAVLVHDGVSEGDNIITQRAPGCEKLARVKADVDGTDHLRIVLPEGHDLSIPLLLDRPPVPGAVGIWGQRVAGIDAGDPAASMLSGFLGLPCRLMLYPPAQPRPMKPPYATPGDIVSFADGSPFHITTTASLNSLKANFEDSSGENVSMARFRPNIVLDGTLPFEEDVIHRLRIGAVELEILKPCERCKVTTINQDEGREEGPEPLAALRRLRRGKSDDLRGFFFGSDAVARRTGIIQVGDTVEILARRPVHPALAKVRLGYAGPNPFLKRC